MTRHSAQPKDRIFAKDYGLLYFAKNMGKNIGENIIHQKHLARVVGNIYLHRQVNELYPLSV